MTVVSLEKSDEPYLPRGIKAQAARQTRRIYPAITPCLVTNYGVFGLQLRRIWFPFCCWLENDLWRVVFLYCIVWNRNVRFPPAHRFFLEVSCCACKKQQPACLSTGSNHSGRQWPVCCQAHRLFAVLIIPHFNAAIELFSFLRIKKVPKVWRFHRKVLPLQRFTESTGV